MTSLSLLLGVSILVAAHMTSTVSKGIFSYRVRRQTELPWLVGLSPATVGWHDALQSRVCCRSETAPRSPQAGGRRHAGVRSSVVTKVVGHARAWCGKTRCWSCCPGGQSQWRRDGLNCTVGSTNTCIQSKSQATKDIFLCIFQYPPFTFLRKIISISLAGGVVVQVKSKTTTHSLGTEPSLL